MMFTKVIMCTFVYKIYFKMIAKSSSNFVIPDDKKIYLESVDSLCTNVHNRGIPTKIRQRMLHDCHRRQDNQSKQNCQAPG